MKWLFLFVFIINQIYLFSQEKGAVKGYVFDSETEESIPFVNIVLLNQGFKEDSITADFDGLFTFKNVSPGNYTIKYSFIGYATTLLKLVEVEPQEITTVSMALSRKISEAEMSMMYNDSTHKDLHSSEQFNKKKDKKMDYKKIIYVESLDSINVILNLQLLKPNCIYHFVKAYGVSAQYANQVARREDNKFELTFW